MTLYETIEKNGKDNPDGIACEYFKYKMTHGQLKRRVDEAAASMAAHGIEKGDRVGICLPNSPDLLIVFYAVNKIGAVSVMLNPKSPSHELKRQIKMTKCKCLFFSRIAINAVTEMDSFKDMIMVCVPIISHMPIHIKLFLAKRIITGKSVSQFKSKYSNAYTLNEFLRQRAEVNKTTDDLCDAIIIFSGGTNGTFKSVVHSSLSLENSAKYALKSEEPLPDNISMMGILPAFHIFGLTVAIHLPLYAGGKIVLVPVFNLGIVTDIIRRECPTFFPGVPTIFERLLVHPKFIRLASKGKLNFKNFKHGFVGGDNLKNETRDKFNEIIKLNGGDGYISMGYGMSECCPICVNDRTSGYEESIGICFEDMKVRILDENSDNELSDGEVGEIVIASEHLMSYGFDEEGNITAPHEDEHGIKWLRTGDMGYIKENLLYYRCRQRRIIKVSGNTIFASSIEKIITDNLDIAKAAYVVPIPHNTRGFGAFAFVVTNKEINDDELLSVVRKVCKNKMISYAIPVGAAHISEKDIPYTAIGKISWGLLENKAKDLMN